MLKWAGLMALLIGAIGFGFAIWVRSRRPEIYAMLGRAFE